MRKLVCSLGVVLGVLAVTLPAMAEVDVYAEIDKTKTVTVTETVNITKTASVNATVDVTPTSAAEAATIVNAEILGNTVLKNVEVAPEEAFLETIAEISGASFAGSSGIIQVNQAPGNINNQGNATSVSIVAPGAEGSENDALTNAQASEQDINAGNTVEAFRSAFADLIAGNAFRGATGIINVNQAAGNMNNQHNSVAFAAGDGVVALSEADLGQTNALNQVEEINTFKFDTITDNAFAQCSGIINVNQSSGNMNNQSNVLSISAITYPNPTPAP